LDCLNLLFGLRGVSEDTVVEELAVIRRARAIWNTTYGAPRAFGTRKRFGLKAGPSDVCCHV
jgi:hypothetical protein